MINIYNQLHKFVASPGTATCILWGYKKLEI